MPNHVHGIVIIKSKDSTSTNSQVETQHAASLQYQAQPLSRHILNSHQQSQKPLPKSLSTIVRSYKSAVTRWARHNGYPQYAWQLRFYDHVIRDEESLDKIRLYILENPLKWETDEYYY